MNREEMLGRMAADEGPWDIVIIGGGATGLGVAVDAASRGHKTLLLEQSDFGKGTSSRSTKLAHGGVRYLRQGNVALVMEALKERGIMRANAPHLVSDQRFIVPTYDWWETPFYGIGMKIYDAMAGRYGFGPSRILSKEETLAHIPALHAEGLNGGVQYYDGKFDDARYLVHLARTAVEQGATLLNYARVVGLTKNGGGLVTGLVVEDAEGGGEYACMAKVVINATGPFTDGILRLDDPGAGSIIAPSQGVHLVFDASFLASDTAIMVPHTPDDRVMFAIPWHDHVVVGTTDHEVEQASLEPEPTEEDIDFLLDTAGRYLERKPTRADVLTAFAGIRPLVAADDSKGTAVLSREHTIQISRSGLVTICGGKWTTYRRMAEEVVGHAETVAGLEEWPCVTKQLKLHGYHEEADSFGPLAVYGSDAPEIRALCEQRPELDRPLHVDLPYLKAEVVWAARYEMARTVDDCLARRTRALFLNAGAARDMAPEVASLLAAERGKDEEWVQEQVRVFRGICEPYMVK